MCVSRPGGVSDLIGLGVQPMQRGLGRQAEKESLQTMLPDDNSGQLRGRGWGENLLPEKPCGIFFSFWHWH